MSPVPLSTAAAKGRLRCRCLALRRALSRDRVQEASAAVSQRLLQWPAFVQAARVHTYVGGRDNEIDTRPFIAEALRSGHRIWVPVATPGRPRLDHAEIRSLEDLKEGPWGLLQPPDAPLSATPPAVDLVVVPGIAFDRGGGRLGYGRGYYDRFLAGVGAPTVGLAYEELLFGALPAEPHDVAVGTVLSETGVYAARPHPLSEERRP